MNKFLRFMCDALTIGVIMSANIVGIIVMLSIYSHGNDILVHVNFDLFGEQILEMTILIVLLIIDIITILSMFIASVVPD